MAELSGAQYRLRASNPMPTKVIGHFVLHTFMGAYNDITIDSCATSILGSGAFRGQNGSFTSASYAQLPFKGGNQFQSNLVSNERFVEEW